MDFSCWAELKNLHIIFNLKLHCYDQKGDIFFNPQTNENTL